MRKIRLNKKNVHVYKEKIYEKSKYRPLVHQVATEKAFHNYNIVNNIGDTGIGKTIGYFRYLHHIPKTIKKKKIQHREMFKEQKIALWVTHTNALISQTTENAIDYIEQHELKWNVFPINSITLKHLRKGCGIKSNGRLLANCLMTRSQLYPNYKA